MEKIPDVDWTPQHTGIDSQSTADVIVFHTGPADEADSCLLAHIALINAATKRLWIASPYFVPPEGIVNALSLAALRGVDVHVLVPSYSDNRAVMLASEVYIQKLLKTGVKFSRYMPGFLHQKVLLVDDDFAEVGSINFDPRSIFINFEIMAATTDAAFVSQVADMLSKDLKRSELLTLDYFQNQNLLRKIAARAANLMSPML